MVDYFMAIRAVVFVAVLAVAVAIALTLVFVVVEDRSYTVRQCRGPAP